MRRPGLLFVGCIFFSCAGWALLLGWPHLAMTMVVFFILSILFAV